MKKVIIAWLIAVMELMTGTLCALIVALAAVFISLTTPLGNIFSGFSGYAGTVGYESVIVLASILGGWLGACLGCSLVAHRYDKRHYSFRSILYVALGGCALFLIVFSFTSPATFGNAYGRIYAVLILTVLPTIVMCIGRRLWHFYVSIFRNLR